VSSTSTSSTTRLQLYAVIKTHDHIFRIRLRLPIETKSGLPNNTALTTFQQWYSAFAGEVQGLFLLPWKDSDMATVSPTTCVSDFPSQLMEFRVFADKIHPRGGKTTLWLVIRVAFNGSLNEALSTQECAMSWYFGEIKGGAYPYEVQSSEDAVEVGVLAYTSNHSNQFHLEQSLQPLMKVRDPVTRTVRNLKIGIVPKMHKDFPKSDKNWDIPTEQPLIVFADRADSKALRRILYQAFNCEPDFMKCPGYLNSRLIPSKDFLSVGSDAAQNWDCLI